MTSTLNKAKAITQSFHSIEYFSKKYFSENQPTLLKRGLPFIINDYFETRSTSSQ